MAIDIDNLQIEIEASASDASKAISSLTRRLNNLGKAINTLDDKKLSKVSSGFKQVGVSGNTAARSIEKTSVSAKKAQKSFDGLASAFGKFYATYFLFIRGAKGIWRNIESSMDYVETSNYFSVALGQIGQQFEEAGYETAELYTEALSSELNKLNEKLTGYTIGSKGEALFSGDVGLGMDIEQMMNFQAKTLAVTNSVGLMGDASLQTAKAVSMLTGDLSSLTNTDLESVMTNLSSGLIGQSRALYKYGIDITQNTLQQYALAEGIEKSVAEMTQAEKMQLRLLAILDQSSVAHSDLANTINSVANQYRVADQQIGNLGRTIGNLFLPVVQNVLPYVNGLIIALNNLFTSLGFELYGDTWLEDLQSGISGGVQEDFEDIEGSADDATTALNEFKKGLRGFDELKVLTGGVSVGSGIVGELEGQIDLTESITQAVADYENSWNEAFATAENKASEFAETLTKVFTATGAVENFTEIVDSIKEFNEAISPFAEGFGEGFLGFFGDLAETSLTVFNTSLDLLSDIIGEIEPETLEKFGEAFGVLVGSVTTFTALSAVSSKFKALADGFSALGTALKAHPILATFTIGAGVLTFLDKYVFGGTDLSESSSTNSTAEKISQIATALEEAQSSFDSENQLAQNIQTVYDKWKLLNDQVELTAGENALLKQYADYLKKYCEGADKYIDENGKSFNAVGLELDAVIKKAKLYYQALAHENYLGKLTEQQIEAEFNLQDIEGKIQELYADLREFNPDLEEGILNYFAKNVGEVADKYGIVFGRIVDEPTFKKNAESVENWARELGLSLDQAEEFAEKLQSLSELGILLETKEETTDTLENTQKRIEEVTVAYAELNAEYQKAIDELNKLKQGNEETSTATDNLTESTEKSQLPLITTEQIWADAYKRFMDAKEAEEKTAEATENLGESARNASDKTKELVENLEILSKKKVKVPVTIDIGGSSVLNLRGILSPNVSLRAYAGGGLVTAGEVFVARENGIPEMVGSFGNQTAVANNDQIVSGIQAGVYSAMVSALATMGRTSNGDIVINMDGREVFRVVQARANEHFKTTGNPAFDF